jgi:hypothetical protein
MSNWPEIAIVSPEEDIDKPSQPTQSYYEYASSWVSHIGRSVSNTVGSIVTFNSYPKEHVEPHLLPVRRTDICDYSGKSAGVVYAQYLPYDGRYGIIHSSVMTERAKNDCYEFCEKNSIFPISLDFLMRNNYVGPYYAKSGDYKNYTIIPKATTIIKDGVIIIGICNGYGEPEYVSLRSLCHLNNINYKRMLELLHDELCSMYDIQK